MQGMYFYVYFARVRPGKKSSIAFIKYKSKIIRQIKVNAVFFYLLIEPDFLVTRPYFLPANQNARLTT